MTERTCGMCLHFVQSPHKPIGECRERPPVFVQGEMLGQWPKVRVLDDCGRHKDKRP